ncbi:MAG: T9SS type A sorting domain-containing protein, partial [Bacteroidales bacterium]|nr:T9SS type A sorting domain-containing protein [Bacteroidales bacterium]
SAEFYNQAGAKVMQVAVNSYEAEVDISTLAKGTYVVVLNTVHGKVSQQIIVN